MSLALKQDWTRMQERTEADTLWRIRLQTFLLMLAFLSEQEVYSREWSAITDVLGDDEKRFDFVVETSSKVYLIEVNFYSDGGSKLNEVARSYSDIARK